MTDTQDLAHEAAMQATQAKVRAAVAAAKEKRGVIIYLYGEGKGKSSSGFGTLLRAVGHGQTAAIVQFIKGSWKTGEQQFLKSTRRCAMKLWAPVLPGIAKTAKR